MPIRSKFAVPAVAAAIALVGMVLGLATSSAGASQITNRVFSASGTGSATANVSITGPELVLAFVAGDGNRPSESATVTGGSLSWKLIGRANGQLGTAEVWSAGVVGAQSTRVTAQLAQSGNLDVQLSVVAYTGASGVGAVATANASSQAPAVRINAPAGSVVYGVGVDWDTATARILGSNQTLDAQDLDHNGDTYWLQHITAATGAAKTVTVNDTSPNTDRWNLAAVAITGTANPPPTTTTVPQVTTTTTSSSTTTTVPSTTTTVPSTTTTVPITTTTVPITTTTTAPSTTTTTTSSGGETVTNVPHPAGFPDATNTGYLPTGVTLHSCATYLNVASATYDSCLFAGDVQVVANNVHITRSKVVGGRINAGYGNEQQGLVVSDTEIDGTNSNTQGAISAMGDSNYTCTRCNVHNTNNGFAADGSQVTIQDSWVHDLHFYGSDHMEAIYSGGGGPYTIIHNNLECHEDGTPGPNGGGCSSAASFYSNNSQIVGLTATGNLFNTTGGDCTYWGSSPNGTYKEAGNVWVTNNYYGRYFNTKCGQYNASIDWQPNGTSTWSGNTFWTDGAVVTDGGYQ